MNLFIHTPCFRCTISSHFIPIPCVLLSLCLFQFLKIHRPQHLVHRLYEWTGSKQHCSLVIADTPKTEWARQRKPIDRDRMYVYCKMSLPRSLLFFGQHTFLWPQNVHCIVHSEIKESFSISFSHSLRWCNCLRTLCI